MGRVRHETCAYGKLTEAFRLSASGDKPTLLPLCLWAMNVECPPAMRREWGGLVEYERDCLICPVHTTLLTGD